MYFSKNLGFFEVYLSNQRTTRKIYPQPTIFVFLREKNKVRMFFVPSSHLVKLIFALWIFSVISSDFWCRSSTFVLFDSPTIGNLIGDSLSFWSVWGLGCFHRPFVKRFRSFY